MIKKAFGELEQGDRFYLEEIKGYELMKTEPFRRYYDLNQRKFTILDVIILSGPNAGKYVNFRIDENIIVYVYERNKYES